MTRKPRILVTNDDGIHSPGINALRNAAASLGEAIVVAPDSEQSAVGHAITISDPLRVKEIEKEGKFYGLAVNGTPADCVKLALKAILDAPPDLVVSGINQGGNTATNVIYSGTVSAATEAAIMGFPAMAFSLYSFQYRDFSTAERIARQMIAQCLGESMPRHMLLNVNIPSIPYKEIMGVSITRQGRSYFDDEFEKRVDPWNRTYYWMKGHKLQLDESDDYDEVAIRNQYVSVTPLKYDLTDESVILTLNDWKLSIE